MTTARIHTRNLAVNWTGHVASLVVMFFLSPFVIHALGKVEYGIWSLLNVVTGYMSILDLGIRASTGRFIIYYLGKEDHEAVDTTIRTSLGAFTVIGGIMLLAGCVLGWAFPHLFSEVPAEYHTLLLLLLPILAVNIWISAFGTVFANVLTAHERFDIARGINLIVLLTRAGLTVAVLSAGGGLLGLVLVTLGSQTLARSLNWYAAHRIYPRLRSWPLVLHPGRFKELMGFGVAAFIAAIAVKIIGQTDLVVVGATISMDAVAVYSVGVMAIFSSTPFFAQINGTFFPALQRAAARGEKGAVRWIYFRQLRVAMILGVCLYVGFIVFSEPFIRLWMMGPKFDAASVQSAALVMSVLAAAKLLLVFSTGAPQVLESLGYVRFNATLAIVEATANLLLSLFFVLYCGWGLVGVAMGTLVARLLIRTVVQPWYACRKASIGWSGLLINVWLVSGVAIVLFTLWCIGIRLWLPGNTWLQFGAQVAVAVAGYLPIAFFVLLVGEERTRIFRILRRTLQFDRRTAVAADGSASTPWEDDHTRQKKDSFHE